MDEISSKQKDFFISYSSVDIHWAEWVAWQLEEEGYTLTLQAWDFIAGSNFVQDKDGASRGSKRIILILSQNYLDTDSVVTEWTAFFEKILKRYCQYAYGSANLADFSVPLFNVIL